MPRQMYRHVAVAGLLTTLLGTTAACGEDQPESASAVAPTVSAAGSVRDTGARDVPKSRAGGQATKAQLISALPTVDDLPSGWTTSEGADVDGTFTIDPVRCQDVINGLDLGMVKAAAEGSTNFINGGALGTTLSVHISSYAKNVGANEIGKVVDAFAECPSFTVSNGQGAASEVMVSPMSFAKVGDQSFAVALSYTSSRPVYALDMAFVIVGHNLLSVNVGGLGGANGALLEKIAKLTVSNLENAAT